MKLVVEWIIFLFILFHFPLNAQSDKLLSVKHMHKDLDELLFAIDAHPDPYTKVSEQGFTAKYEEIKNSITEPLNTMEFYKKAASLVALIKDGHSALFLPRGWLDKKRKEHGVFPFEVFLSNEDELYITRNYGAVGIPTPYKIISLNGITVSQFLEKIDPYISYELKRFRNTIIDDRFEMYLYLAFGFSNQTEIEYVQADTAKLVVQNIPIKEWSQDLKNDREEREKKIARGEPYDYKQLSEGVGMISIYSFAVESSNIDKYDYFLGKTFKQVASDNIHSLIIDVRGNYGGWPKISAQLFQYITEKSFKTMAKSTMKVSQAYREHYYNKYPFLRHQNNAIIDKQKHFIDLNTVLRSDIGSYQDEDVFYYEEPETKQFEFSGDCYLLTNRDSYSSASSFAATFQCYQLGTIIGEETGGTKVFRANAIFSQLARSSIWVKMATTKFYCACYTQETEGVTPIVTYTPSIFEIDSEMDTQLLYTQRLIKKVQKRKAEGSSE